MRDTMEEVPPGYVAIGRVGAPWGVRGAVRVLPLTDRRAQLAAGRTVTVAGERRTIESTRWQKGMVHLRLSGIEDREAAAELAGRLLAIPESELEPLPEGQYYRFQLIGLAVISTDGEELGGVTDVLSTGANDVYIVSGPFGEVLIPAVDDVVRDVNITAGVILVEIIPGLLP